MKKTADIKFSELCYEVDYWKDEAKYWKNKHDEVIKKHSDNVTDCSEERMEIEKTL